MSTAKPVPVFYEAGGSGRQVKLRVEPVVTQMSWGEGGPLSATVEIKAASNIDIWQFTDLLRARCEIMDKMDKVWIGYVKTVKMVMSNGLVITTSLDKMYNSIRVLYSQISNGVESVGEPIWSTWWQDAQSVARYGTKSMTPRMSQASYQQMNNYRARALKELAWPLTAHDLSRVGTTTQPSVTITAAGWWETLGWLTYQRNTGSESYKESANQMQTMGGASGNQKIAQSFQLASLSWSADQVALRIKKVGAPADTVTVDLCSDSSGAPGTVLSTTSIVGTSLDINTNWVTLSLSTRIALSASTTYWLVIRRSGSVDAANYYMLDGNEALGYSRGVLRLYNGSSWVARSPDADLTFEVLGVWETTYQIADVVNVCGQFILSPKCVLDTSSGIYASPYQDGTQTGLAVIRELLKSGGSGNRRLRANIRDDRVVYIDDEPAPGINDYAMQPDGTIVDRWNAAQLYPPAQCWIHLANLLPIDAASVSLVADPTRAFIEESTWRSDGRVSLKLRGTSVFVS